MKVRKLAAALMMVLAATMLSACGNDDLDEGDIRVTNGTGADITELYVAGGYFIGTNYVDGAPLPDSAYTIIKGLDCSEDYLVSARTAGGTEFTSTSWISLACGGTVQTTIQ